MATLFNLLFGCSHKNYSFPITLRASRGGAAAARTYVVCLDCGKEFAYDWNQMRVVASPRPEKAGGIGEPAGYYATK